MISDHGEFYRVSSTYASAHDNMASGKHCGDNFANGVTNGAQWYPITGGMQGSVQSIAPNKDEANSQFCASTQNLGHKSI